MRKIILMLAVAAAAVSPALADPADCDRAKVLEKAAVCMGPHVFCDPTGNVHTYVPGREPPHTPEQLNAMAAAARAKHAEADQADALCRGVAPAAPQ